MYSAGGLKSCRILKKFSFNGEIYETGQIFKGITTYKAAYRGQ